MPSSSHESPITDPDSVTSRELLAMSLRSLSRNVSLSTSPRSTMAIYLRWLEIHRQEPSRRTEHWTNTIMHWTQSLASRHFHVSEVVAEVRKWQEDHGPFQSKWHRHPPTQSDIERAFKDYPRTCEDKKLLDCMGDSYRPQESDSKWRDRSREKMRPDEFWGEGYYNKEQRNAAKRKFQENFEGPPPPNYICNRCDKKGMLLFWLTKICFSIGALNCNSVEKTSIARKERSARES